MAGLQQDYQAPSLTFARVWSASESYFFYPLTVQWNGSTTVTVVSTNHYLITGDVITLASLGGYTGWNLSNKTVTVVDANTFTFPQVSNPGSGSTLVTLAAPGTIPMTINTSQAGITQNQVLDSILVTCNNYSRLMFKPEIVQVEALAAGVSISINAKVHPLASWVPIQTVADTDGLSVVKFSVKYNIVRCSFVAGSTQPTVYSQSLVYG